MLVKFLDDHSVQGQLRPSIAPVAHLSSTTVAAAVTAAAAATAAAATAAVIPAARYMPT